VRVSLPARLARTTLIAVALSACCASPAAALNPEKYAVEEVSVSLSSQQAGAHADLTVGFELSNEGGVPFADTRDVEVATPPGVIGNPQAIPSCSVTELGLQPSLSECPVDSQVGISRVSVVDPFIGTFNEPVYNMDPPAGKSDVIARFGFFAGAYPAFINVRLDPTDYSVIATVEGAPSAAGLTRAETTLWGVPADPSHDEERLTPFEALKDEFPLGGRKASLPPRPFLSNPTDCSTERQLTITATSYQLPNQQQSATVPFPQITGCGKLEFSPTFTAIPTNPEAFAPTGLETTLTILQDETAQGRATSALRSAVVSLPQGMTINPAAGDGLAACSESQVRFGENVAAECPDAAKIGSVEMDVPALARTLHGSVYQRTPEPGKLFRFWLVADEQGVHLKLPAEIEVDPVTGQLTTVFSGIDTLGGNPQVPFEELRLSVFGGPRAPLATPGCGDYQASFAFAPWSGKAPVTGQAPMKIDSGCGKGGFSPQLAAGMESLRAGSFSPFVLTLTRQDGEANPQTIALHMPQGLLAKLGGVPLCPDAAADTGACPAASRVGSIAAAAGVGGAPLWIPQPGKDPTAAYLAGPYKGAPYSIVSVVPAQAGPFDLGLVVNRAAIQVDPNTALATVITDPLPQILQGVPVSYRTLHVVVDRPEFTLNPTSCEPKQIRARVTATNGAIAEPSTGFQATNCAKLAYAPKLKLSFTGSTKRTGNPGVKAVLTQKAGQANTAAATVILPGSQFIDNSHINNPCTRVQFNAEACPKGSILGTAEARTPLLSQPLKGNVYFRSNGGERELPDIVADLRGSIRITLVGFIDSVKGRVRTRFLSVPDAPVSKFTIKLFAGKRSLIENSENLCRTNRRAKLRFVAQSGKVQGTEPVIGAKCGKGKQRKGS
jgi:hypothetical protein